MWAVAGSAEGRPKDPPREPEGQVRALRLRHGTITTDVPVDVAGVVRGSRERSARFVLQLEGPLDPQRRAALEQLGVELGDYLPPDAFIARWTGTNAEALGGLEFVRWASALEPAWKLDPRLSETTRLPAGPGEARAPLNVTITLFAAETFAATQADLTRVGVEVHGASPVGERWVVDATVPVARVQQLANLEAVQFVEPAPVGSFRNDTNAWIVQSNDLGHTPVWDAGILGQGQLAGIIDGTIREDHCSFDDSVPVGPDHRKIVAMRNAGSSSSHGTHCAGTLAGDADVWGTPEGYDGLAPAARLSFSESSHVWYNPSTLYTRLQEAHLDGARVHSNSWGDDGTTAYTTWCQQIDEFSYNYEDSLVLFAVTNMNSLKTPENAKNVLAVGASRDTPQQDYHCSGGAGPTADGRRKPEVFAPGCSTWSASSSTTCGWTTKTGTSMACPAVAGAGVLVRQYFTDGYYPTGTANPADGFTPSGALLKAVLVNSAVDMTGIAGYPTVTEGWGRVLLDGTLYFPGDPERLDVIDVRNAQGLSTGEEVTVPVEVTASGVPLRVTLVFTDPPAAVNAADPVINNLDLEVIAAGGTSYRGNVLVNGQSAPGGNFDARNNVEQVLLTTPVTGGYTVVVRAAAVNQGTQGFALVLTGATATRGGDCDRDGTTTLSDYERFESCLTGPDATIVPGCWCSDLDEDGDADLADFAVLQNIYTHP